MKKIIKFASVPEKLPYFSDTMDHIFSTQRYIKGVYNQKFSEKWAEFNNAKYCSLTSSGTTALFSSLKVLMPKERTKVIVPNLSYSATVDAVLEAGHIPVYCKVLPNGCIDQEEAEKLLADDPEILAIVIVHLYGQKVEINKKILNSLIVIEDACQAHGVLERVQGQAACFSFYPSKNLGAIGDGGAIVTNVPGLANRLQKYINCGDGLKEKYVHSIPGLNFRMDEIKAGYLFSKVNHLYDENSHRVEMANQYRKNDIVPITSPIDNVYHLFPILVENSEAFRSLLRIEGIETGQHYPYTLSGLRGYEIVCEAGQRISSHNVTLPMGPHLNIDDIQYVSEIIHKNFIFEEGFWKQYV